MILGVFLHGSYLYAAGKPWIVKDGDGSTLLLWLNEAIHFFRIPCFFILSGFFTQMLIERKGKIAFIRMRMRRLALPLVSTALLLNPLQAYFIHGFRTGDWKAGAFVASGAFAAFWMGGEWIGHLWFLVYVLLFSFAAAAFWAGWKRMGTRIRALGSGLLRPLIHGGSLMFLLSFAYVAGTAAPEFLPFLYWNWGGLSLFGLLIYSPYFAFGLLIYRDYRVRETFHRVHPWQFLALPVLTAINAYVAGRFHVDWVRIFTRFLHAYLVWTCCSMLFALFRRLLQSGSRVFVYLSEASYSVYLFHHVCVVVLGVLLAGEDWNVLAKFAVVVGLSLSISLAMHHFLVLRFRVLRLLFMGK
jgi:glucan biosynthesis protein C